MPIATSCPVTNLPKESAASLSLTPPQSQNYKINKFDLGTFRFLMFLALLYRSARKKNPQGFTGERSAL